MYSIQLPFGVDKYFLFLLNFFNGIQKQFLDYEELNVIKVDTFALILILKMLLSFIQTAENRNNMTTVEG